MFGLFVQKHAEAVSLYCHVKVLYVQPDENIDDFEMVYKTQNNLSELIVYYPVRKQNSFSKTYNIINYYTAYWNGYKKISSEGFKPDIIHANILTRTAFVAFLFKLCKGIPYIVTEHWSRYLPERNSFRGTFRKLLTRLVVKNAKAILPVSDNLKQAMLAHKLLNNNYIVVNNAVDNIFFCENPIVHRSKKRMIHVSCFDEEAKNVKGIIRATYKLSKKRLDFELICIGVGGDFESVKQYADTFNFPKGTIHFLGEKTSEEVANWIQNSDFFVLYSNFENSPVVISESLVCGKPVISSNVGGISELINDSNGILISAGNEDELLNGMNYLLDNFQNFDSKSIKANARDKFSYSNIGMQLTTIYKNSISKQ